MSDFTPIDVEMMSRAISLAKRGTFTTAPNPNVGCVLVREGEIVGEGFHLRAGEPHAEVHAMRMAGEKTHGATAYVTLEPCSHYGRTPPCAEGLIKAGVTRVICAMEDPNPKVAGRGFAMLREAGIEVQVGLLQAQAEALNPAFIKRMKTGMPYVQLKMAASLDGQSALANGQSQWITSPQARRDVQRYRAQAGAILSTSKTVLADNASLNVRWEELPETLKTMLDSQALRQPLRVVLDRHARLHDGLKLYHTHGERLIVGKNGDFAAPLADNGQIDLVALFAQLSSEKQINHIWVEAGATLAAALIQHQLVDELIIYLAPKLMGGDGRSLIGALGLQSMADVMDLDIKDVRMVGPDIRIIAHIKTKEN